MHVCIFIYRRNEYIQFSAYELRDFSATGSLLQFIIQILHCLAVPDQDLLKICTTPGVPEELKLRDLSSLSVYKKRATKQCSTPARKSYSLWVSTHSLAFWNMTVFIDVFSEVFTCGPFSNAYKRIPLPFN